MDNQLYRQLGLDSELDQERGSGGTTPGKSSMTSRLAPAPQMIFRVSDPETARALGEAMSGNTRVQRRAERDSNGVAEGAEAAVDRASASSGSALPGGIQRQFEGSLGADLSGVRVHTGADSETAAHAVGAKAYTVGQDIHFGAGKYQPADPFGLHLLAHEVAHTVQQSGGATQRQHKLEVSGPQDAAEHEADRAADAMVSGRPADLGTSMVLARKQLSRDVDADTGTIQGAGDEAEGAALKAPLSVDSVSVTADQSKVAEIISTIDKNHKVLSEGEKDDDRIKGIGPLAVNAATKAKLQVFNDSLGVTSVDTAGFAVQFRTASADYKRLTAEGNEYLAHLGVDTAGHSSVDTMTDGFNAMGADSLKMGEGQAGLQRFRAARANLNTSATKMDGEVKAFRGAAQGLQGALYSAKGKAAAASGADAAKKLAAVKAEIEAVAKGVSMAIKVASTVASFAGTGGAAGAMASEANTAGTAVDKMKVAKAFYGDADKLSQGELGKTDLGGISVGTIVGGDPAAIAESLVTIIGNYCNKEKIANLQQTIATAAAEEKSFNAAGDAATFAGHQTTMEAAASKLKTLVSAFEGAKKEMSAAADALMAELNKGGKKGKDQAKGVLFLSDADRFLAQVTNAITSGENQQANVKSAADQRKSLRGTTNTIEAEPDRATQKYYTGEKFKLPGKIYGTNDAWRIHAVDVTFGGGAFGTYDGIVQGGSGSVEGGAGAGEGIASKIKILRDAKAQVVKLQSSIQRVLGTGGPGLNA